jgi:hypothetical protein
MRENSLLGIGSLACSHKNGIFDWVVVFVPLLVLSPTTNFSAIKQFNN